MTQTFHANIYSGSNKVFFIICGALSLCTLISIWFISLSLIPVIIFSLLLIHACLHALIKNLITFKATEHTVLNINNTDVIFSTQSITHFNIAINDIEAIATNDKKSCLIFKTHDNDSYSIAKYCFDEATVQQIKSAIKGN